MTAKKKNTKKNYVEPAKFLADMIEFRESVAAAQAEGEPRPRVSEAIGEAIMKIATHLSFRPNFINYPFRDEMISDGVENCLQYIDNFDPEKGKPFSYFTQIIFYAFLRRIDKEKKHLYIRLHAREAANMEAELNKPDGHVTAGEIVKVHDNEREFIATFESKIQKNKEKAAAARLERAKKLEEDE